MLQFASGLRRSSARSNPNSSCDTGQYAPIDAIKRWENSCHRIAKFEQLMIATVNLFIIIITINSKL